MLGRLLQRLRADLPPVPLAGKLDAPAIAIPSIAAICFTLSDYNGSRSAWPAAAHLFPKVPALTPIAPYLYWFGASVVLYLMVPLVALRLIGEPLREYGLGPGRWRLGLRLSALLLAVMIPVVLVAARTPAFAHQYPLAQAATRSTRLFVIYELAYCAYFVAWEHVFRAFLLVGLYRRIGPHAIFASTLPFVLFHFGKPEAEAFGSLLAGVALGWLALRTRSFWWGALIHMCVAVTMDVAAAWSRLWAG